jgi:peptidoglycan hydrolase CwlO-like protein
MPEVESYTFEKAGEAGSIRIHVVSKDNADIRKELSVALSGAGMPILSMNKTEKSLEDIFLELTDEHAETADESDSPDEKAADESDSPNEEAEDEAPDVDAESDDASADEADDIEEKKEETEHDSDL